MIEIKIPKDITEYKERLIGNFTVRQAIFGALSIGISVAIYRFLSPVVSKDLWTSLIIIAVIPLATIGFVKYRDMPFEKHIVNIFQFYIVYPQTRVYDEINFIEFISDDLLIQSKKKKIKLKKISKKGCEKVDDFAKTENF